MARNSRNLAVYRDGELVGLVIFDHITPVVCECHIYFKRSFWGRERTIPALRLAYQWAERAGYEKMTSPVLATNRLMIGLLKRLGAVQEGHFRAHTRQNGRPVDMEYWSIFKGGFNG
jgi:RimJ/RimL family protein N-acetyltransferase